MILYFSLMYSPNLFSISRVFPLNNVNSENLFLQAEDGIRSRDVTGVQTCALPIYSHVSGINAVGGMIVAGPEGFRKKAYRKFNIRGDRKSVV